MRVKKAFVMLSAVGAVASSALVTAGPASAADSVSAQKGGGTNFTVACDDKGKTTNFRMTQHSNQVRVYFHNHCSHSVNAGVYNGAKLAHCVTTEPGKKGSRLYLIKSNKVSIHRDCY